MERSPSQVPMSDSEKTNDHYLIGTTLREALPNNLFEAPESIEVRLRRGKILAGRVDRDMTGAHLFP
jgi:hypothetical protein